MAENETPAVPIVPVVPITPGNQTTEYKVAKAAGLINLIGLVVGAILSLGPSLVGSANPNSKYAIIGGCVIGLATVVNKTLIALNYVQGRATLKIEQTRAQASVNTQMLVQLPPTPPEG